MRILIAHNFYRSGAPSGENVVVETESAALRRAGHEVITFARHSDDIATWPLKRRALLPLSVTWSSSARDELATVLQKSRPDVMHIHNTFPLLTATILRAGLHERVPMVSTFHNYQVACAGGKFFRDGQVCHDCDGTTGLPAVRHGCYRDSSLMTVPVAVGNVLHRRAWQTLPSAYIFISNAQRQALESLNLPPERSFVKWNLVPHRSAGQNPQMVDQVVYIGRLDEVKGLLVLMDAWDRFRSRSHGRKLRLVIAGNGPLESKVRTWATGLDDVDVLGLLTPSDCQRVLSGSLAAIVPSAWQETFGLVAVEAMSSGVAVVGAAHGSLPELIRNNVDGALFAPGCPDELSNAFADIATSPERWRQRGAAARVSYEQRFDPVANLEQLLTIYRFAIENPTHTQASRSAPALR